MYVVFLCDTVVIRFRDVQGFVPSNYSFMHPSTLKHGSKILFLRLKKGTFLEFITFLREDGMLDREN